MTPTPTQLREQAEALAEINSVVITIPSPNSENGQKRGESKKSTD